MTLAFAVDMMDYLETITYRHEVIRHT